MANFVCLDKRKFWNEWLKKGHLEILAWEIETFLKNCQEKSKFLIRIHDPQISNRFDAAAGARAPMLTPDLTNSFIHIYIAPLQG